MPKFAAQKILEYNEGRKDILTLDPNGEKFGAVVLAAGWRPYEPEKASSPIWDRQIPMLSPMHQFEEIAAKGKIVPVPPTARKPNRWFYPEPRKRRG
jgi:quinone-modifying oxidoreductase, subunit QmoB